MCGFGNRWFFVLLAVVVVSVAIGVIIYCLTSVANVIIDAADYLTNRWRQSKK